MIDPRPIRSEHFPSASATWFLEYMKSELIHAMNYDNIFWAALFCAALNMLLIGQQTRKEAESQIGSSQPLLDGTLHKSQEQSMHNKEKEGERGRTPKQNKFRVFWVFVNSASTHDENQRACLTLSGLGCLPACCRLKAPNLAITNCFFGSASETTHCQREDFLAARLVVHP